MKFSVFHHISVYLLLFIYRYVYVVVQHSSFICFTPWIGLPGWDIYLWFSLGVLMVLLLLPLNIRTQAQIICAWLSRYCDWVTRTGDWHDYTPRHSKADDDCFNDHQWISVNKKICSNHYIKFISVHSQTAAMYVLLLHLSKSMLLKI